MMTANDVDLYGRLYEFIPSNNFKHTKDTIKKLKKINKMYPWWEPIYVKLLHQDFVNWILCIEQIQPPGKVEYFVYLCPKNIEDDAINSAKTQLDNIVKDILNDLTTSPKIEQ